MYAVSVSVQASTASCNLQNTKYSMDNDESQSQKNLVSGRFTTARENWWLARQQLFARLGRLDNNASRRDDVPPPLWMGFVKLERETASSNSSLLFLLTSNHFTFIRSVVHRASERRGHLNRHPFIFAVLHSASPSRPLPVN